MNHVKRILLTLTLCVFVQFALLAQNEPVIVHAELGVLGSDYLVVDQAGVSYVSIQTNLIAADNPGNSNRAISYNVTFPAEGVYELYARVRVGPGGGDDDSFFYGNGFGSKTMVGVDWITANQLSGVGWTAPNAVIIGNGNAGTGVWKWIKLSAYNGGEAPISFTVPSGALSQTFQIGGRENGFDIDKFAFTRAGLFFTVSMLDNGQPGSPIPPGENFPVIAQAENSTPLAPSDPPVFLTLTESGVQFVRVQEDFAATSFPGTDSRVRTFTVTFAFPGTYHLYGRLRVGSGNASDDSYYIGRGFGPKISTTAGDWLTSNNLWNIGFTASDAVVIGNGDVSTNVFKWVNFTSYNGITFVVPEGNLTQTFQIGSRENGLDFDKFAFGRSGVFFTVANLDNVQEGSTVPPPDPFDPSHLSPIAQGKPKFLGSAHSPAQNPFFANYWNQVTPENGGKWGSVEGTRDVMNWTDADSARNLASRNGFPFRFHVLFWGNQQPAWIESLPPAEQLEEIREWVAAVADRYEDDIDFLEVVNEPLHDPPNQPGGGGGNYINALGGSGATGWDWILNAFRIAREFFPNTKLVLNDFSITNTDADAIRYIGIINLLKAENLIDVVGVQGHAFSTTVPNSVTLNNLNRLAQTGLPIQVTELDIDGPTDQIQLNEYKRIFPVFWEHPAVNGITLWGWRIGHWRTAQGAYLVLNNGAERPALRWLREYVNNTKPVINAGQSFAVSETAANGFVLGTPVVTDPDTGQVHKSTQWLITGGTGASLFAINALTGAITVSNNAFDFETTPSYTLILTVSDGFNTSDPVAITVNVINTNETPTAAFTLSPQQGFAPLPVSFDASTSSDPDANDILTYEWDFGDGDTGTGVITNHTYTVPGNYVASLVVLDAGGLSDTLTANVVVNQGLKLQYKVRKNENKPNDNHIRPFFQIVNIGDKAVPYNQLTIRYWYTRENKNYPWMDDNLEKNQQFWCDYAALGTSHVKGKFVALSSPTDSADYYVEVSFTSQALLNPTKNSGEIQTRFNNANWSDFSEFGDYSYDPTKKEYADWDHVTLYRNGELIWGIEPGSDVQGNGRRITSTESASEESLANTSELILYPNPSRGGRFTVEIDDVEGITSFQISDAEGREVVTQTQAQKVFTSEKSLDPGIYFIKIVSKNGVVVKKLVVH